MEEEMKRPEVKTVSAVEGWGGWEGQLGVEDGEDEGMKEKESELRAGGMWVEDTQEREKERVMAAHEGVWQMRHWVLLEWQNTEWRMEELN